MMKKKFMTSCLPSSCRKHAKWQTPIMHWYSRGKGYVIPGSFAEANFSSQLQPSTHTHRPKHTNQPFIHPTTASQPKSPLPNSSVISEEPGGQATPTGCFDGKGGGASNFFLEKKGSL